MCTEELEKNSSDKDDRDNVERFVAALGEYHSAIYSYIVSLLISPSDADDVMQETCIALWRKYSEYDRSKPFFPWARSIAHIEVLRYRQKKGRSKLLFGDSVLAKIEESLIEPSEVASMRRAALGECLKSMDRKLRTIVRSRYHKQQSVKQISIDLGRPKSTVYKMLLKARSLLANCIEVRLRQEDHLREW